MADAAARSVGDVGQGELCLRDSDVVRTGQPDRFLAQRPDLDGRPCRASDDGEPEQQRHALGRLARALQAARQQLVAERRVAGFDEEIRVTEEASLAVRTVREGPLEGEPGQLDGFGDGAGADRLLCRGVDGSGDLLV